MKGLMIVLLAFAVHSGNIGNIWKGERKLTLQEAERILGEPCRQVQVSDSLVNGIEQHKSSYIANSSPGKNGQIVLYYMYEKYPQASDAQKTFEEFWVGNRNKKGFELRKDLGDQAFFHSDGKNFDLLVARKGNKMFRFKVSKITAKTSVSELNKIANGIAEKL